MVINLLLTKIFYTGTLIFSLFAISASSQIMSIILLIASFVCAALLLVNLGLVFVGLSYIVIYVGAIAVLFLFVIMMIDINKKEVNTSDKEYTQNLPLAIALVSIFTIFYSSLVYISPTGFFVPSLPLNNGYVTGDSYLEWCKQFLVEINTSLLTQAKLLNNIIPVQQHIDILSLPNASSVSEGGYNNFILHYSNSLPGPDNLSLSQMVQTDVYLKSFEQISSLGFGLYNYYSVIYLLSGFILLFSMYSAVSLSKLKN